ncbi:hypothetical protein SAY86_008564 [Trapa natans]|uniref:Uncharacterized protein n=1 Tax=Trapa natans TaxID=22666 RepID=A0AAN7QAW6_TRANT|nr:hypothetical protein SAY86_008564 [Trapa natans]
MPEMEPPVSELSEKWGRQPRLPPKRGLIKIKIFKTIFQSTFTSARKSIRPTSDSDAEGETAAGGRQKAKRRPEDGGTSPPARPLLKIRRARTQPKLDTGSPVEFLCR